jgi:uncharacterized protein (DUF1697 family)
VVRSIALLRAVNVGGRKMPMAELQAVCCELGWEGVQSFIQSGNIIFAAPDPAPVLEDALEQAIQRRWGYHSDVMVRSARQWTALLAANPLPNEAEAEPSRLLVGLAKARIRDGAAAELMAKAAAGERVEQAGEALWFHYPEGVGTSKLTPRLIDRCAGSPVTSRNWRTMLKLAEMAGA